MPNITMKLLTVSALLCALMALTSAAEEGSGTEGLMPPVKSSRVKRSPGCPIDWIAHRNRCFRYITKDLTWADAERNCLSLGGNLASVHNIWDEHMIRLLTGNRETWTGGNDAVQEGTWFWSDGSAFHHSNWCPGEPSNGFSQHCLQINYRGARCWDDLGCNNHLPSVCVRKM